MVTHEDVFIALSNSGESSELLAIVPLIKRRDVVWLVVLVGVFIAIGLLRLPLQTVLLVAVPLSIAITFVMRRRTSP